VESEGVDSLFRRGPNKRTFGSPESPIAKFIDKREGIHHIAFAVENIVSETARLQKEGFVVLNEIPKRADNKLVAFSIPKYKWSFN
jgi:methylmalonyl-CoA/ethylmalonyl-CoA epimerase